MYRVEGRFLALWSFGLLAVDFQQSRLTIAKIWCTIVADFCVSDYSYVRVDVNARGQSRNQAFSSRQCRSISSVDT